MIFRDNDFQDMDSGIMYIRDFELRDFVRNPIAANVKYASLSLQMLIVCLTLQMLMY